MREAFRGRSLQALLIVGCLVAGASAAGGEPRRERVTLSVEEDSTLEDSTLEELDEPGWGEDTPEDEADALAALAFEEAPLPVQVDPARPELLWVPAQASRDELASRLLGDPSRVGAFD
jgi:hypothetical protein